MFCIIDSNWGIRGTGSAYFASDAADLFLLTSRFFSISIKGLFSTLEEKYNMKKS